MPILPVGQYMTITLRGIGFGTLNTNLLTIPRAVFSMFTMITLTYLSETFGQLAFTAIFMQIWILPFVVYLYVVDITKIDKWVAWGILTFLLSYPSGKIAA